MPGILGELTPAGFLAEYWQRKPCLIRGALPGFEPPIDGDDLAGLACEAEAESRLVSGTFANRDWTLRHGPFEEEEFPELPETNWTLLVQDVEKHYPPLQDLMDRFDFLPSWRLDDLMISYAVPGGSVGPHVDQYDVFLLQAQGQRLWRIATDFDPELLADCPLNVLADFDAQQEWIVRPGDVLYLPPGIAHHGVALDECLTYSIGLRAPSAADLFLALGEALGGSEHQGGRYADPGLEPAVEPGQIDDDAIERLHKLMRDSLDHPAEFAQFAGRFLTRFRLALRPANPEPDLDARGLLERLQSGQRLVRNPWTRLAWTGDGETVQLFAAGDTVGCSHELAQTLCSQREPDLFSRNMHKDDVQAVVFLVNQGHLVLTED